MEDKEAVFIEGKNEIVREIISEKLGFRIKFMEDGSTKIYSLKKEREIILKKYMKERRKKK